MGKIKSFEIQIEDNKAVFQPGEPVKGRCTLELKSDLKLRALRIFMRGLARVHWTESRSTGTRLGTYTEHYNAEVEYFHKKILIFGSDNQEDRDTLTAGQHEFDFNFELPSQSLATSFEGKHGSIRYWLRAEMDVPWSLNHRCKKAFTVITQIDINRVEFQIPVEHSIEKSLCCWVCISGPISVIARSDRKGYCPGESIAISADFENSSSRTIVPYATLHQNTTFFANRKSRVRSTKFTSLTGLPIAANNRATWDTQLLKIPNVSPSIMNCNLIKVDYYVKVALHIPGAYNLAVHLPIVIGTVPHRHVSPYFTTNPRIIQDRSMVLYESQMVPCPPPYQEMDALPSLPNDPPTYVESYGGVVNIADEDDEDDVPYIPMYTYVYNYDFRPPPSYCEIDPGQLATDHSSSDIQSLHSAITTNAAHGNSTTADNCSTSELRACARNEIETNEIETPVAIETVSTRL